jgi:hypothetical protein
MGLIAAVTALSTILAVPPVRFHIRGRGIVCECELDPLRALRKARSAVQLQRAIGQHACIDDRAAVASPLFALRRQPPQDISCEAIDEPGNRFLDCRISYSCAIKKQACIYCFAYCRCRAEMKCGLLVTARQCAHGTLVLEC